MKIPFFKMSAADQAKSKGMIAGWGSIGFSVYVFTETKDINQALPVFLFGMGILGLRDKDAE